MTKIDAVNSAMATAPYFALSPQTLRALRNPDAKPAPKPQTTSDAKAA